MEDGPAIGYNRRLRVLTQLSFFLPIGMLYAFEKLDLSLPVSQYSLHFAHNYYGALLLYWSAVHLTMTVVLAAVNAASYNLERHYKLTRQSYGSWFGDYLKRRLINWLVTSIGLVWFYSAVRSSSERWFLLFWPAIVLFYGGTLLLFDSLVLPLFYRVVPLGPGEVSDRLSLLAARAGISRPKFAILQVGRKTPRANALVTGLVGRYRILITDTALETLTLDEIEAIVAHEIGHQVKHHTTTRLLALSGLYFLPLWLANLTLPELISDLSNFAYLPYLFISFSALSVYLLAIFCFFARAQEESRTVSPGN